MSTLPPPSTSELEAALKSTLHSLSLILSFHSSVQSLQVTPYAPHAPRQHTQQLRIQSQNFDSACNDIEKRLLRALAVLERDARKAAGQPPILPIAPPADTADLSSKPEAEDSPAVFPFGFPNIGEQSLDNSTVAQVGTGIGSASANNESVGGKSKEEEPEESFLHDSLFGDSVAPSPSGVEVEPTAAAGGPTTSEGAVTVSSGGGGLGALSTSMGTGTSASAMPFDLSALLPPGSAGGAGASAVGTNMPDYASLLALVGNPSSSAPPSAPAGTTALPISSFAGSMPGASAPDALLGITSSMGGDFSLPATSLAPTSMSVDAGVNLNYSSLDSMDFSSLTSGMGMGDFSSLGMDFTGGGGATGEAGLGAGGVDLSTFDFGSLGDFSTTTQIGELDLDELMKSFGSGSGS
ncbi:hypothetical protein T439DRAFT_322646 [Meredithblackwellia eburnea MCA 4105]